MARPAAALKLLAELPDDRRALGVYKLVQQLGQGGFAPVWLAKEVYGAKELRTVAIKLFAPDAAEASLQLSSRGSGASSASPQRDRIVEEARALCRVEHPNVVRFYAIHDDPRTGVIGLVMEHVHGTALDVRLRDLGLRGEKMPLPEVLDVGVAIASALAAVHQVGLVHRDIKPANVVEAAGIYKLIDFGIAAAERRKNKLPAHAHAAAAGSEAKKKKRQAVLDDLMIEVGTKASMMSDTFNVEGATDEAFSISGTMGYIDPHCVETMSPTTSAGDLYALGATLFECMTGSVPAALAARRMNTAGLSAEVLDGRSPAPPLSDVTGDVPEALARLVDRLLDPAPSKRPKSAEAVAWELERIRREVAGRARPLPPESVGPFRGLGRFEAGDRDVYFGRAVEIAASIEMMRSRGLLALIGASGSGKSSLARAGVLPAVEEGGLGKWPKAWDVAVTTPGADARASITQALAPFTDDARSAESLISALGERAQETGRGVVLLVDQLEELVTVSSVKGHDFAAQLLALLGAQVIPGVRAVVAARRDLLDPLLALGALGRALTRGTLLVSTMSETTWEEVVDQALSAYGYALEDEALRSELLQQLKGTATAMPLVQFALTQLWERRDTERKIIPRSALTAIGGVAGALEMHAEATLERHAQKSPGTIDATRLLLLAMTTPQGTRRTRARAELLRLHALAAAVLERLEHARLVVQEPDGLTIAHEALLAQWGRLKAWIAEAREDRLLAEAVEREAREWDGGREASLLWKGRRLVAAEDLARKGSADLSEAARAFVRAGRAASRRGRLTVAAIAAALLAVAALGTAKYVRDTKTSEERAIDAQKQTEEEKSKLESKQQELAKANDSALTAQKRAEDLAATNQRQAQDFSNKLDALNAKIETAKDLEQFKEIQQQVQHEKAGVSPPTPTTVAAAPSTVAAAPPKPPPPVATNATGPPP